MSYSNSTQTIAGKKVLVIDDEPDIVTFLEMFLEDHDFEVISETDGVSGLARAKIDNPDIITLDITMPGKSGTEVFRQLRLDPSTKGIPVIIITGVMDFRQFIYQRQIEPPEGYMEKPIDAERLLMTINDILSQNKVDAAKQSKST